MRNIDIDWRGMTAFDLDDVNRVANMVHPGFFEAPEVLAERHQLYRNGTFVLEVGERISGYVLSHPWRLYAPPPLNELLGALPDDADTYYIHDIALLPLARKVGAASQIVEGLIKHAKATGFATMSLVAVHNSAPFWSRFGFTVAERDDLRDKLACYGADAQYMVRQL